MLNARSFMNTLFIILVLTLTSISTQAATCKQLKECISLVSSLTGNQYLYDKDVKGPINLTKNFKITKANADSFLSEALSLNGYTKIATTQKHWTIISARDVRYNPVPNLVYGKDTIPNNFDYVMVSIKLKNPHLTSELSRNFRPFMSRYGRIIDIKSTGTLIISDTGRNARRLIHLVEQMDKKPTKDEEKKYEKKRIQSEKLRYIKASKCADIKEDLKDIKNSLWALETKK